MKKLMIALAAAATTMFSFGDDDVLPHGADFEASGYVAGENFTNYVNRAEDGVATSGNRYWYSTSEDIGVISNHQSGISVKSVPDLYENATPTGGVKYLQLDTQTRLFRTIANNDQSGSFTGVDMSTGDGVYLDTLVKFTAADAAFGTDALEEAVDKIAIEYVEREIEYGTGDEANVVKVTPLTNFVVRAGFIGSAFATNYLVDVPEGWLENNMKDDWHRLTVRALTNIDGNNRAGFKIYLDEVPLVYRTDKDEFAQSAGFEDDTHMIFPSAVASGVNKTTISAVAFSGNGSIDDVVFTTTKPKFIAKSEAVVVPFVADAGVTTITVTVPNEDPISVDMTADPLVAVLPAQTTAFTVNVTVDEANGYTFGSMTVGDAVYNTNPASVTGYAGGNITITAARNNVTYIDDNDQQQSCPSLATAFANAKSGTTITLAYDVDAADTEDAGFEGYTISSKSVVLDLNGQTITWNDPEGTGESLFNIEPTGSLRVIDSSASNTGKIVYGGEYGAFNNGGECYVGAASGDYGPTIEGILYAVVDDCGPQIVRGKFDKVSNSTVGETPTFIGAADYIEAGSELKESLGDYWIVAPKGGSTTFALTTTGGANAMVTTNPADVLALTEETEVTITATADQDYTYDGVDLTGTDWTYDSQTDAISMTTNISENTTVVVPDAVSEQSQEDWPEGEDLIDAEGKAAGDLFPGITNALATADAKAVATWAEANKVEYAAKGSILPEAFLLNCANTQAAIDEAAANFKVTAITVVGDTVTITPADGADYGNGKVVIEGTATLSPISWHEKTDGDHFFRATLVVKPVTP